MTPEGWRRSTLGRHLREPIKNGYSPNCPASPTGKWIAHLGAVSRNGFVPAAVKPAPPDDPKVDALRLVAGDLLVSRSNTRERVGLAGIYRGEPAPCSYPDLLMRVRPSEDVEREFLLHALLSQRGRDYFRNVARGTSGSMVKIDRTLLESFPLLLPPLAEQRRIATVLGCVDSVIELSARVLDQLAACRTAMMRALTDGAHGEERSVTLGDVSIHVTSGSRGWARYYSDAGALFLRITNLTRTSLGLDLSDIQRVAVDDSVEGSRTRVAPGDLLISITADLGMVGVVPRDFSEVAYVNQHIALVRLDQSLVVPEFAALYLSSVGQRQFTHLNDAGAKAGMNLQSVRCLRLTLPALDEQRRAVNILAAVEDRIAAETKTLQGFRDLKESLSTSLLDGDAGTVSVRTHEHSAG